MIIPCNINLITTVSAQRSLFAIYMHRDINKTIQYIGVCPLTKLFEYPDALCNSEWLKQFSDHNTLLETEVVAVTDSEREALQERGRLLTIHRPQCNVKGHLMYASAAAVICDQTGERFPNAAAAARAHGITPSALSNHLNRVAGHKSVKGKTYRRIIE